MSPVSPVTKAARHAQIAGILDQAAVRSQEELADWLAKLGVRVTQTTLSRDLEELGAVRLRGPDGALFYALPGEPGGPGSRPGGLIESMAGQASGISADGSADRAGRAGGAGGEGVSGSGAPGGPGPAGWSSAGGWPGPPGGQRSSSPASWRRSSPASDSSSPKRRQPLVLPARSGSEPARPPAPTARNTRPRLRARLAAPRPSPAELSAQLRHHRDPP